MEENIIKCNKCGKEYDYNKSLECPHCGRYQDIFDEDFANGQYYPGSETYD